VRQGYSREWISLTYTLQPDQFDRAAQAPPFGDAFQLLPTRPQLRELAAEPAEGPSA